MIIAERYSLFGATSESMSDQIALKINRGLLLTMIGFFIGAIVQFTRLEARVEQMQSTLSIVAADHDRLVVLETELKQPKR